MNKQGDMSARNGGETSTVTPKSATPKHTPGPWVAFDRLNSTNLYSKGNNGSLLAAFHSFSGGGEFNISPTRRLANATIAAAAPAMLEALIGLTHGLPEILDECGVVDEEGLIDKALAAIALATIPDQTGEG